MELISEIFVSPYLIFHKTHKSLSSNFCQLENGVEKAVGDDNDFGNVSDLENEVVSILSSLLVVAAVRRHLQFL